MPSGVSKLKRHKSKVFSLPSLTHPAVPLEMTDVTSFLGGGERVDRAGNVRQWWNKR